MQPRTIFAALLVALTSFACAESTTNFFRATPKFYSTAEENYTRGARALEAKNWITADEYFKHVRATFGFSKWATLAELGEADADFGQSLYTEAIDGYKGFIKAHPGHEHVVDGYAAYRIGLAYYKQIPADFFIMPPSYEKDQGPVLDALRELTAYTEQYGDSVYVGEAKKLMSDCVKRLTEHELYVARFYLKANKPTAAIGRLEGIIKAYPASTREAEIMLLLGRTYLKMKKPVEARATFQKLASQHPGDYRAKKAQRYIDFIDHRNGAKL